MVELGANAVHIRLAVASGLFLIFIPLMTLAVAQTPPPQNGNWIISDTTIIEGEDIELFGDLIVESGGDLTLQNCTISFRCALPGQFSVIVQPGGRLHATGTMISGMDIARGAGFESSGELLLDDCELFWLQDTGVTILGGEAVISDCEVHDSSGARGEGISVYGGEVMIAGNELYNVYRGVAVMDSAFPTVEGNLFHDNEYGLAAMATASVVSRNNTMRANTWEGLRVLTNATAWAYNDKYLENYQGATASADGRMYLQGCTIANSSYYGVFGLDRTVVHVNNTDITTTENAAVVVSGDARFLIDGCTIHGNSQTGIYAEMDSRVEVNNTQITDNGYFGLNLLGNISAIVTGSEISRNHDAGIYLNDQAAAEVRRCTVHNNSNNGILADGASSVDIENCLFIDNGNNGVYLLNSSSGSISSSRFETNLLHGVHVESSTGGRIEIENNVLIRNIYGIGVTRPSMTHLKYNEIIDCENSGLVFDQGSNAFVEGTNVQGSGMFGVFIRDISRPKLYNCSISDSGEADLWIGGASNPTLVNTSYESSMTHFDDTGSLLYSGWWVECLVLDEEGETQAGAVVSVTDGTGVKSLEGSTNSEGGYGPVPVIDSKINSSGRAALGPHNFTANKGGRVGTTLVNVTSNMLVRIVLGTVEVHEIPLPGDLILSFENLEGGEFLRGDFTVMMQCSPLMERVRFKLEGREDFDLGEVRVVSGRAYLFWNTSEIPNGRYTLVAEGLMGSRSIETEVDVVVDNAHASLLATVATVGLATMASIGGAAAAGGIGGVEDTVGEYAEEMLYEVERKGGILNRSAQVVMLIASALLLAASYTYAFFSGMDSALRLFIIMLISVTVVVFAMEIAEHVVARRNRVGSTFSLWPIGILTLIVTTLLFRVPFGSPSKTKVRKGEDVAGEGVSALAKLVAAPAMLPLMVVLIWSGQYMAGVVGGYTAIMLFLMDTLPFYPLEGKRVFDWNKGVWLVCLIFSVGLLLTWQQVWIGYDSFFVFGLLMLMVLIGIGMTKRVEAVVVQGRPG